MLSDLSVDKFLSGKPLALTVSGLEELRGHIMARLAVFDAGPSDFIQAALNQRSLFQERQQESRPLAVGVIQIRGTISQHAEGDLSSMLFGGSATEAISAQLKEFLADDSVGKIVLDIDSPGGVTYGVSELAAEIFRARGQKPIVAVANSLAASAAYWIGSAADEFYVTPGGMVGSIGVYAVHQDISKMAEDEGVKTTLISAGKYKTSGNQFEPLDDEARGQIQARVNDIYEAFISDVARGRGVPPSAVRSGYGQGDVLTAKAAKAAGMVDGIATYDEVLRRPVRGQAMQQQMAASSEASLESEASESTQQAEQIAEREDGAKRLGLIRLRKLQDRAAQSVVEV